MRIVDIIIKKRDGFELDEKEIDTLIQGYTSESVPDYQMAAWLMAVFFRGMSDRETAALTIAMARSGEIVDLGSVPGVKVDKHSTGGVADTTTLVLAPLVAAAGVPVAKMSGRGLGFTGGTIDKLESIPGFRTVLSRDEFLRNLRDINLAVTGQTGEIAPADGKIYALRDVIGTVESIPLIASSIMSKKIAAGADKIVLDVKVGSGAFMKTLDDAIKLASAMVKIGDLVGRKTSAVITSMEEPLGRAIGNSLEVEEAIDILAGKITDSDLSKVCMVLGGHMLTAAGISLNFEAGCNKLGELLKSGQGMAKFIEFIKAQGGNPAVIENRNLLPRAAKSVVVANKVPGYIQKVDAARIGYAAMLLGAGREFKGQEIDLGTGLIMQCRVGEYVKVGQTLAVLHVNSELKVREATEAVLNAIKITPEAPTKKPLVYGVVNSEGIHLNN